MDMNRLTQCFLWTGVAGWGISILGVLLPWSIIEPMLMNMGLQERVAEHQIIYWFRMATGGWTIIGFFFFMTAIAPTKYRNLIPLLAIGSLFEGSVLLIHGLILSLPLLPFWGDVTFCFIVGIGLLFSFLRQNGGKNAKSSDD